MKGLMQVLRENLEKGTPKPIEPETIAILTPIYKAEKYIFRYLKALENLDYPKDKIRLYILGASGDSATLSIVEQYFDSFGHQYQMTKLKHLKQLSGVDRPQIRNLVLCRNTLADISKPYDAMWIDSDVVVPPETINRLRGDTTLGADMAGGIYLFRATDRRAKSPDLRVRMAFPLFCRYDEDSWHPALAGDVNGGWLPKSFWGKRIWVDALATGCLYVKRAVHDKVRFRVPTEDATLGEDVAFGFDARDLGFKVMGDTAVFCEHWGLNLLQVDEDSEKYHYRVETEEVMVQRRRQMMNAGVY